MTSQSLRSAVGHPVIDADGHVLEVVEATYPYLREALGAAAFDGWRERGSLNQLARRTRTLEERRLARTPQGAWWGAAPASNVRDRATAMLPALLHERMDELGIDYTVLYPTSTLLTSMETDPEVRTGLCSGFNSYFADVYGAFADRIAVAGMIPMHTPEEAVSELQHCHRLGLKAVCLPEGVLRPMEQPAAPGSSPWLFPGQTHWFDAFGLDSAFDYDPVWRACGELGFVAAFHGGLAVRPGISWSVSSYVANHVGQFAAEMYQVCKALLFGGVTRRFPELPFAFLECGVSWGAQMLNDVIEHWEKRNLTALGRLDPARLDREALVGYFRDYGGDRLLGLLGGDLDTRLGRLPLDTGAPAELDDFVHMDVSSAGDIVARLVGSFYFGCEADDRGITTAFMAANPLGARLRAVFSSDIGHWDVTDMSTVVADSHRLVEEGHLTPAEWRQLVFEHPAEMYLRANPHFFDGTPVEPHLDAMLANGRPGGTGRTVG